MAHTQKKRQSGMTFLRIVIQLYLFWSMIFSENRNPPIGSWPEGMLFRIMLEFSLPWI